MSTVVNASPHLRAIAETMAGAAGWKKPRPGSCGSFSFRLKGGMILELLTPENKTGIFRGDLGLLSEDLLEAEQMLARLARLSAGRLKTQKSVLSLTPEGPPFCLELAFSFDLVRFAHPSMKEALLEEARDFLNDYAWWKKRVSARGVTGRVETMGTAVFPPGWVRL